MNKDKVVYEHHFNIDAETQREIPYQIITNLYENAPNGGVLVLKIESTIKDDPNAIICEESDEECRRLQVERAKEEGTSSSSSEQAEEKQPAKIQLKPIQVEKPKLPTVEDMENKYRDLQFQWPSKEQQAIDLKEYNQAVKREGFTIDEEHKNQRQIVFSKPVKEEEPKITGVQFEKIHLRPIHT